MEKPKLIKDLGYRKVGNRRRSFGVYLCPKCKINTFEIPKTRVNTGRRIQCKECWKKWVGDTTRSHGKSYDKIYAAWSRQKARCTKPFHLDYSNYGGRGVKFSEEFLDFEVWYTYVSSLEGFDRLEEEKLTLDRIDNDGNYERGNMRWATKSVQSINQRRKVNKTGYQGIKFQPRSKINPYTSYLKHKSVRYNIGNFPTKKEALEARNKYIIDNNLPNLIQEYKGEN